MPVQNKISDPPVARRNNTSHPHRARAALNSSAQQRQPCTVRRLLLPLVIKLPCQGSASWLARTTCPGIPPTRDPEIQKPPSSSLCSGASHLQAPSTSADGCHGTLALLGTARALPVGSSELSQMWEQEPFDSLNSGVRQGCLLCQGVRLEHPSAFSCTLSVPPNSTAGAGLFCEQGLKFQL